MTQSPEVSQQETLQTSTPNLSSGEQKAVDEYALIKKMMSESNAGILKSRSFTWDTFRALEDKIKQLPPDTYLTSFGKVQVYGIPQYAHSGSTKIGERMALHFTTRLE